MSLISTALAPDDIFGRHSQDNSMRNVIYAINLTLDGCCDHTKFNRPDDDEVLEHYTHLLRDFDLLVYGRKTKFRADTVSGRPAIGQRRDLPSSGPVRS